VSSGYLSQHFKRLAIKKIGVAKALAFFNRQECCCGAEQKISCSSLA